MLRKKWDRSSVKSRAHVPFGGVKESGFGAYSIGPTAKDFYMKEKTVCTK
jgi:aldehyde dehydrogenase (NAD+)